MHSLRHTFATLSLEAGRSVKWVSQQLGHRDASLTLNTYARSLREDHPSDIRVNDFANRWGFWHMGQFAADYRRLFAELPARTLRRGDRTSRNTASP
jgi:hypothetical protein